MTLLAAAARRLWRVAFFRFAAVGGAGFLVNALAMYFALNFMKVGAHAAWFIAFAPAVTFTWWGNRKLTFPEHASLTIRGTLEEWMRFTVTNGLGAIVNAVTYEILLDWGPPPYDNPFVALAIGVLMGLVFNFTLSKWFVFRRHA